MTLTRADIERKRDSRQPDCVPECSCWPETLIRDLATTALGLMDEGERLEQLNDAYTSWRGMANDERKRADTAEARIRALEEGLRWALGRIRDRIAWGPSVREDTYVALLTEQSAPVMTDDLTSAHKSGVTPDEKSQWSGLRDCGRCGLAFYGPHDCADWVTERDMEKGGAPE